MTYQEATLRCLCTNPECVGPKLTVERVGDMVALSISPDGGDIVVDRRELAHALGYDLALIPREDAP
jgi:hypothetical protein